MSTIFSDFQDVNNINLKVKVISFRHVSHGEYLISYSPDVTHTESGDTDCYW